MILAADDCIMKSPKWTKLSLIKLIKQKPVSWNEEALHFLKAVSHISVNGEAMSHTAFPHLPPASSS